MSDTSLTTSYHIVHHFDTILIKIQPSGCRSLETSSCRGGNREATATTAGTGDGAVDDGDAEDGDYHDDDGGAATITTTMNVR